MLEEVLALFLRRYGLNEPDGSAGCRAIQGAMRGEVSIASLRIVLTEQYELYPHYRERVMGILDQIEEQTAATVPASSAPVGEEVAAVAPARQRKTGRK